MSPALLRLAAVLMATAVVAGCPPTPNQVIDTPKLTACESNDQCSTGALCVAGECRLAECNPAIESVCGVENLDNRDETCCKIFENCNPISLTCERDPNATGIGCPPGETSCIPCEENRDCVESLGFQSFCSGARCFEQAGRETCTEDFQCGSDQRCDRTEFFCVPDEGACRFCSDDFPELCCQNGQVCDLDSGSCISVGDRECEPETVLDDCRIGSLCDPLGRCVQCISTADCGPNTECNPGTGLCESTIGRCDGNSDCSAPFVCIDQRCAIPECEIDRDCNDVREDCVNFACVLPPAVCNESDEPNNNPGAATELASLAAGYGGLLCRGDQDFLSFPVQAQKRYVVTVTIASGNTPFTGIALTLTDTQGGVESTATYAGSASIPLVGVSGPAETGRFTLAVNSGSNVARDQWGYTVTIREEEASAEPDCSAAAQAGQEPNDAFATATSITLDTPTTFSRCGAADTDFFKVDVPALNGVRFTVDGFQNAEGNLNVELFSGPSAGEFVVRGTTAGNSEVVTAPEGSVTYFLKVVLASPSGALNNQLYTIKAEALPRPAACDADVGENDGSIATATVLATTTADGLVSGSQAALRCNAQDVDHVSLTLPANLGGSVRLTFTHSEGDLALDLLNEAGEQVATSNLSNAASGAEAVDLPQSTSAQTFIARVRLGSTSGAPITGQTYTLSLSTFDAATCLTSEPAADDTFATARCLGTFDPGTTVCNGTVLPEPLLGVLATCQGDPTAEGCFLMCGNSDNDFFRVGSLEGGRTISARLRFDPAQGALDIQVGKLSSGGDPSVLSTTKDLDGDGLVAVDFLTSGSISREHFLTIRPDGPIGHEAQVYALEVNVSEACIPDSNEAGTGNATAGTATVRRPTPTPNDPVDEVVTNVSICATDVDVYEIFAFGGESIEAKIETIPGARLRLGTRPANLALLPVFIPGAEAIAGADGIATVPFTPTGLVQLYIVVDRAAADAATGDYTLTLDYNAP